MGVLLGLTRTHARSPQGTRVYDLKPFYRGAKVTVIGAISLKQVLAVMTLNGSMDGNAFEVFIQQCLVPQLWSGATVVMDNLPAHQIASIKPLIAAVGASVLNLSPYSPEFNPIERAVVTTQGVFALLLSDNHQDGRYSACNCTALG